MFARTPAMPTRTCSQIVVIFASVPLPAPAAAAVFGTMAMMDPKIVPRSSTTGILCFFVPAKGGSVGPGGDVSPRAAVSSIAGIFPAARTCVRISRRPKARRSEVWLRAWLYWSLDTARLQIPAETYHAIVGARASSPVFA